MGMQEGTVVAWRKKEGDAVGAGEVIAEIEAAKTTEELTAPEAGVLTRIVVPEGATVPVRELLAVLTSPTETATEPVGEPVGERAGEPEPAAPQVTPRARRLARGTGVDLARVAGTGPGGRITEEDVRAAAAVGAGPDPAPAPGRSSMRATIARRMYHSLHSMAQLTLVTTADVTDLVAYRHQLERRPRPGYIDMLVKAVALALRQHPALNATMAGDAVRVLPDIHIGLATAVPDGLLVPVVRDADRKSLDRIAAETAALIGRVRDGTFGIDDVSGSTFTVSSLSANGIDAFTPIINPPEAAILGAGRIVEVATRGPSDNVVWRKSVTLSLTIDHRVTDGAPGAAFLATVGSLLGSPQTLDS
jgi:pyruvate dehydrogenase E2 component (dihydrolipoamide acetyltransferase)